MKKEAITLYYVKNDLEKIAYSTISNAGDWRFSYIIPFTLLAILIGVFLGSIVVGVLIFSVAAYHIVQYCIAVREYKAQKKALQSTLDRGDVSVSVKTLSHIKAETIYEPHAVGKHRNSTKTAIFFHFYSGGSWRVPDVFEHYVWSKDYCLSSKGLDNISLQGDEFFYISLQGYYNVAYIYPCKLFELDETLKGKLSDGLDTKENN